MTNRKILPVLLTAVIKGRLNEVKLEWKKRAHLFCAFDELTESADGAVDIDCLDLIQNGTDCFNGLHHSSTRRCVVSRTLKREYPKENIYRLAFMSQRQYPTSVSVRRQGSKNRELQHGIVLLC